MKSISMMVCAILMAAPLLGEAPRVTATSISQKPLYFEIDRHVYTITRDTIEIEGLQPGYHDIRIYGQVPVSVSRFGRGDSVRVSDGEVLFSSRINLKEDVHLDLLVNRFGRVLVDEGRIEKYELSYRDHWVIVDPDLLDVARVMNRQDFEEALSAIKKQTYQAGMLDLAKHIVDSNNFNCDQVKRMLDLFWTGTAKAELAKYAYAHTLDKGRYFKVIQQLSHWDRHAVQDYIADFNKGNDEVPTGQQSA